MSTKASTKPTVRGTHQKATEAFFDSVAGPFRRAALSAVLYPITTPRSRADADHLADTLMRGIAKAGKIQRHGHLHWLKISQERTLLSGRTVPEMAEAMTLQITTRCPNKWVSVDLETGDAWTGSPSGWRKATPDEREESMSCLNPK